MTVKNCTKVENNKNETKKTILPLAARIIQRSIIMLKVNISSR